MPKLRPILPVEQILSWADAHRRRSGRWPNLNSGPVHGAAGETWYNVNAALRDGWRGLPGGDSLARLLARSRGAPKGSAKPPLTATMILSWADDHHKKTGSWPTRTSAPVAAAPGERWAGIDTALREGFRGLPGGDNLAGLLQRERGVRGRYALPPLKEAAVLRWAKAHHRRTGRWPSSLSGPVAEAPGEKWLGIDQALRRGRRGLPGGSSLARLLRSAGLGPARRGRPPRAVQEKGNRPGISKSAGPHGKRR
jgi:hypothetical protein